MWYWYQDIPYIHPQHHRIISDRSEVSYPWQLSALSSLPYWSAMSNWSSSSYVITLDVYYHNRVLNRWKCEKKIKTRLHPFVILNVTCQNWIVSTSARSVKISQGCLHKHDWYVRVFHTFSIHFLYSGLVAPSEQQYHHCVLSGQTRTGVLSPNLSSVCVCEQVNVTPENQTRNSFHLIIKTSRHS